MTHPGDIEELVRSGGHPYIKLTFTRDADDTGYGIQVESAWDKTEETVELLRATIEALEAAA